MSRRASPPIYKMFVPLNINDKPAPRSHNASAILQRGKLAAGCWSYAASVTEQCQIYLPSPCRGVSFPPACFSCARWSACLYLSFFFFFSCSGETYVRTKTPFKDSSAGRQKGNWFKKKNKKQWLYFERLAGRRVNKHTGGRLLLQSLRNSFHKTKRRLNKQESYEIFRIEN